MSAIEWLLVGVAIAAITVQLFVARLLRTAKAKAAVRQSISCEPEVIRPKAGACGVHGCMNTRQHSHVEDLVRRIKEGAGR